MSNNFFVNVNNIISVGYVHKVFPFLFSFFLVVDSWINIMLKLGGSVYNGKKEKGETLRWKNMEQGNIAYFSSILIISYSCSNN